MNMLYVANFHSGQIEVYNSQFALTSTFADPNAPAGYAPYNIQDIGGNLYVTYAKQDPTGTFAVAGIGNGFVDEFTPAGTLMQRLITAAPLDAPWGMALAPSTYGQYAGDLLVANQGSGQVDAFSPSTGQFLGALPDPTGAIITNSGLHGLFFGPTGSLYFTAGLNAGVNGLFASLTPTPATVAITPATLAATVSNITTFVGQAFNGIVATFTDANSYALPTDFTATVQWGDGITTTSGSTSLAISQTDGPGSAFVVKGTHFYFTATTGMPPEILKITITENVGGNSVSTQGTASVSEPTIHAAITGFTAYVGIPYTGPVATFTDDAPDSNLSDYSATITWGDGTTTKGTITASNSAGQGFIVTDAGAHVYKTATTGQTSYVVTVSISKSAVNDEGDTLDESGEAQGNLAVSAPTLHGAFSGFTAYVGIPYTGPVATFTDDAPDLNLKDYAATINWGDGTTTAGAISQSNSAGQGYIVSDAGAHVYKKATTGQTSFVVTVMISKTATGTQGASLNESTTVQGNVPVAASTLHVAISGFTGYLGIAYTGPVATFTDDAPDLNLKDYSATISWGDGTTTKGTITQSNSAGQGYIVTDAGAHTYKKVTTGQTSYVITVLVTKTATGTQGATTTESASAQGNVAVSDPTLHAAFSASLPGSSTSFTPVLSPPSPTTRRTPPHRITPRRSTGVTAARPRARSRPRTRPDKASSSPTAANMFTRSRRRASRVMSSRCRSRRPPRERKAGP